MNAHAFRLVWPRGNGDYHSTPYGFTSSGAAKRAAQSLNRMRLARQDIPFCAIVEFDGAKIVQFIDLSPVSA